MLHSKYMYNGQQAIDGRGVCGNFDWGLEGKGSV
jgi:hypothetical protein